MNNASRYLCATLAIFAMVFATSTIAQRAEPPSNKRPKMPPAHAITHAQAGSTTTPGGPLAGLSGEQTAVFDAGLEEFEAIETPDGGLGPIFNDRSCGSCHTAGAVGGASDRGVTRFGREVDGKFDTLEHQGGSLLQSEAIDPGVQETIPSEANVVATRITTPLFGAGLIEAIRDEDIEGNALRRQPDGIQGRALKVVDVASGKPRIGRFGWKAQQATLLAFAGDAYLNEMGVTSRLFPDENAPNGRTDLLSLYDMVPDIEDPIDQATGKSDIDHATDFMRLLAPPPQTRATAESLAGARAFEQAGCAACHTPVMTTGPSEVQVLAHQPAALYSDLLLHDMGSLGDGIEQAGAGRREMRTAPLWGLRFRPLYLHDGRATTVDAAIRQHAGTAIPSRQRYEAMTDDLRQALLAFLQSI